MQRLSGRNARVAQIRTLARQRRARVESGRFLVEGPKLVQEALAAGVALDGVFVDAANGWESTGVQRAVDLAYQAGVEVFELDPGVFKSIGASQSPQPVLAVAQQVEYDAAEIIGNAELVLVAVDINDPGNMGTLMRSAVAAGADALVLLGHCVDAYSPKTVRASAGALFHVPVAEVTDQIAGLELLGAAGLIRLGMAGDGGTDLPEADLTRRCAVVVGSEAHGLPLELMDHIDEWVSIPMEGPTESLNVAMAATIVLYESLRQRRAQ